MKRSGFTLIELLAALLLAGVVLASALTALRLVLRRGRDSLDAPAVTRSVGVDVMGILERDLANGIRFETIPGKLIIVSGQVTNDPEPMLLRVEYSVEDIHGLPCLFRAIGSTRQSRSLLCSQVNQFQLAVAEAEAWSSPLVICKEGDKSSIAHTSASHRITDHPIRVELAIGNTLTHAVVFPRGLP